MIVKHSHVLMKDACMVSSSYLFPYEPYIPNTRGNMTFLFNMVVGNTGLYVARLMVAEKESPITTSPS